MKKKRRSICCWLVLLSLCFSNISGQRSETDAPTYPKNAGDVGALAEILSRADYSVSDATKHFGTVNPANRDDEVSLADWSILLTPSASARNDIKRVLLYTYNDKRKAKLESVQFDYLKPIQISYGELVKKYGPPSPLPLPRVKCAPGVNCHPAFVGYGFRFVPGPQDPNSGKRLEVVISLEMEWSKVLQQHTATDLLAVKTIRFRRILAKQ